MEDDSYGIGREVLINKFLITKGALTGRTLNQLMFCIVLPFASLSAHHKKVEPCLYTFQASVREFLNDKSQRPWFGGTQLWPPTSIEHDNVVLT